MPDRVSEYQIYNTLFLVSYGDITKIEADVLVSSDDNYLSMGGGVSDTILCRGGNVIRQDARKHVPLSLGDVVVTTAGKLNAKYVFHTVTIDFDQIANATHSSIQAATLKCLQLADALNQKSIAFPALGTGVAKFPFQLAAEVMTRTIAEYLTGDTVIERVHLSLFARELVTESDLNLFYERSVAIASMSAQGKRLNALLVELQKIIEPTKNQELVEHLLKLQAGLLNAEGVLSKTVDSVERLDKLEAQSGLAQVSREIVELSDQTFQTAEWQNNQLETEIIRTKFNGLLTQLNVLYGNRNKLQVKKAKFGIDTPLKLENELDDLQSEIDTLELKVQETRTQLFKLTASEPK